MATDIRIPRPATEQAIQWVVREYSSGRWSAQESEVGCLFWAEKNGIVTPGKLVDDGEPDRIRLYRPEDRLRVLGGFPAQSWPKLAGEFHAHPVTQTLAGQLPSPDDLFLTSVASDHWEIDPPLNELSSIPVSPKFSAILMLRFGDMWVIEPDPARSPYLGIQIQKDDLAARRLEYEAWHRLADRRLGPLSPTMSRTDLIQILRPEAAAIHGFVDGRCTVRLQSTP